MLPLSVLTTNPKGLEFAGGVFYFCQLLMVNMADGAAGRQPTKQLKQSPEKTDVKRAALEWADFLYREYKREKALSQSLEDNTIVKPTHHGQSKE